MGPQISPRRVLIVDDDPVVAESLALILSGNRYEVRVAYSAESATQIIERWIPEIAILDVLLPGMNGHDFAGVLQAACPGCPVLFFTALPGGAAAQEFGLCGGREFDLLEKPVPPAEMLNKIADLLAKQPGRLPVAQ
ncbi:MAG TPA: response regulator [Terracidiphilus sp.]|nr:response regulator [Terracidiphilus sp.]